jgi:uncharacterized protein YxjI
MRYQMKQELFSWGDDFYIKDESGQDRFFVDGKALSIGKQLSFQDLTGKELCFIDQKLLSWSPKYEIYRDGAVYATVTKELFTFFNCRFDVELADHGDIEASGDFSDHSYTFTRNEKPVAQVSMEWFTLGDNYGVEITEGQDDVLILACTVVIDMACHQQRR